MNGNGNGLSPDSPIFASNFSFILGEQVDIAETAIPRRKLQELAAKGLQRYSQIKDETLTSLARKVLGRTISRAKIKSSAIEAVVFCTSSYWYYDQLLGEPLGKMLCDLELSDANIIVSSVMGCHNAVTALRLGRNLIVSEGKSTVACVTVDIASPMDSRLGEGQTVVGDGAASCLLSTQREDGYVLVDVFQRDRNHMHKYSTNGDNKDFTLRAQEWLEAIAEVANVVLARNRLVPADIALLINNNYNTVLTHLIASRIGVSEEARLPFNSNTGHVLSSDTLIALGSSAKVQALSDGAYILLIGSANCNFGAVLMRKMMIGSVNGNLGAALMRKIARDLGG